MNGKDDLQTNVNFSVKLCLNFIKGVMHVGEYIKHKVPFLMINPLILSSRLIQKNPVRSFVVDQWGSRQVH